MEKDRKDQPWIPITRSGSEQGPAPLETTGGQQELRFEVLGQASAGGMPPEIKVTNRMGLSRVYVARDNSNQVREFIDIILDGPPDHEATHLVDVQDERGLPAGAWMEVDDGSWALRITPFDFTEEGVRQAEEGAREQRGEREEPEYEEEDEPPEEERGL